MKYDLKKWNKQDRKIKQLKEENERLKKLLDVQEATLELNLPLLYNLFDDVVYTRKKIVDLEKKILLMRIAK